MTAKVHLHLEMNMNTVIKDMKRDFKNVTRESQKEQRMLEN